MAYKEVSRVDIAEVIRRWQRGNSQRHIASGVGLSRDTVRKYLGGGERGWDKPGRAGPHRGTTELAGGSGPDRPTEGGGAR